MLCCYATEKNTHRPQQPLGLHQQRQKAWQSKAMELQKPSIVASALTPQQAAEQYKVDAECGLSSSEAEQRLALHGPNCAASPLNALAHPAL